MLLIITVDEIALARKNKKSDDRFNIIKNPLPTPRPPRDPGNHSSATPTPVPSPSPAPTFTPTQTPTPVPVPDDTPTPEPVLQPVPQTVQYSQPAINPTPVATPDQTLTSGPDLALAQNATTVLSLPPEDPEPTFSPMMTDFEREGPGLSPGMIISALMGLACIGYIAYLGFMMMRR
jgi:hypothetical protein